MTQLSSAQRDHSQHLLSSSHSPISHAFANATHYTLSAKFLEKHKELQDHSHQVSDRFSSTVPTVLSEILLDSRLAWYIKRLVIYSGLRSMFNIYRATGENVKLNVESAQKKLIFPVLMTGSKDFIGKEVGK